MARVKETEKDLKHALKVNRYVADFLLDEEEMPERLPGSYAMHSREEAIYCADMLMGSGMAQTGPWSGWRSMLIDERIRNV